MCWDACSNLNAGDSVIHSEVVYPEFELISNPVKDMLLLGAASCNKLKDVLSYVTFFLSVPE